VAVAAELRSTSVDACVGERARGGVGTGWAQGESNIAPPLDKAESGALAEV